MAIFPSDRHPDYYDGLREGALALRDAIRARPAHVSADFAPDYCLINVAAAANAAEQAMRAVEEQAMAPQPAIAASVPFPPEMHRDATEYVREAMVRAGEEACSYLRRRAEPVEADAAEMDRLAARFPQGDGPAVPTGPGAAEELVRLSDHTISIEQAQEIIAMGDVNAPGE